MFLLSAHEKRKTCGDLPSRKKPDAAYRSGMALQVLGAAILAVLYPLENPFYTAGIMLFELGALLSGLYVTTQLPWIRSAVLCSILVGIPLQLIGIFVAPPEYAIPVILAGIGLVCAGAAGMAGKEAYCFGYGEGWLLMWLYPIIVLINAFGREQKAINALFFSVHFLLLLSLTGRKLKQPLPVAHDSNTGADQKSGRK